MYPHERSLVKQLADKPFTLIGVNSDDNLEVIREVVKEKSLTWRSFQNAQEYGAISDRWGIQGWPTIFVLDQDGKIRYRDVRGDDMDDAIEKLLSEMGHDVTIAHEEDEPKPEPKNDKADDAKDKKSVDAKEDEEGDNN